MEKSEQNLIMHSLKKALDYFVYAAVETDKIEQMRKLSISRSYTIASERLLSKFDRWDDMDF